MAAEHNSGCHPGGMRRGCKVTAARYKVAQSDVKWWAARYKMAAAGYKWQDPILLVFGSLMDSKELSSIWDCFGDQKAIKTPKLNTI